MYIEKKYGYHLTKKLTKYTATRTFAWTSLKFQKQNPLKQSNCGSVKDFFLLYYLTSEKHTEKNCQKCRVHNIAHHIENSTFSQRFIFVRSFWLFSRITCLFIYSAYTWYYVQTIFCGYIFQYIDKTVKKYSV